MGFKRRRKQSPSVGTKRKPPSDGNAGRTASYDALIPSVSEAFTTFYKAQHIVQSEEWDAFIEAARIPLPESFRVNSIRGHAVDSVIEHLKTGAFKSIASVEPVAMADPKVPMSPPVALSWYGDGTAWQIGVTKRQLKKHPACAELRSWLQGVNEAGLINRQEVVNERHTNLYHHQQLTLQLLTAREHDSAFVS